MAMRCSGIVKGDVESGGKDIPVISEIHRVVGARIKSARQQKGLDQLALAQLVGYKHASAIAQIEKGTMNATLTRLQAIATVLGKDLVEFFPEGTVENRECDSDQEKVLIPEHWQPSSRKDVAEFFRAMADQLESLSA